jgi:hypothetical protein
MRKTLTKMRKTLTKMRKNQGAFSLFLRCRFCCFLGCYIPLPFLRFLTFYRLSRKRAAELRETTITANRARLCLYYSGLFPYPFPLFYGVRFCPIFQGGPFQGGKIKTENQFRPFDQGGPLDEIRAGLVGFGRSVLLFHARKLQQKQYEPGGVFPL